jgi:hypothetical protein
MQTALQQAIEEISDYGKAINTEFVLQLLEQLLPIEQSQIERAYNHGSLEKEFGAVLGSVYNDSSDYFTQTHQTT